MVAIMKANLQILDAMLAVVLQFTKSPDKEVESAATDELQELAKRRAKLLKADRLGDGPSPTPTPSEGAGKLAMVA